MVVSATKRFGKFVPMYLVRLRLGKRFGKFRRVVHGGSCEDRY